MSRSTTDRIFIFAIRCFAGLNALVVGLILVFMAKESWPVLQHYGLSAFFSTSSWNPLEQSFGIGPLLVTSILLALGSLVIGFPLGLLYGIFVHFYAPPKLQVLLIRQAEIISSIPSVVFGLWGLVVLVPQILTLHPPGTSLIAGILILSVMTWPIVALNFISAFRHFPQDQILASHSLSLSKSRLIRQIILPSQTRVFYSTILMQFTRSLGETMAVLMVCGNVVQWPTSLFDSVRPVTSNMALEMAYAQGLHRSSLFVSGLILLILVFALIELSLFLKKTVTNV